ncbi:hypothetical protein G6F31_021419 [Rhizopus arrhizus]|nr:hypothetical protein G6F31_021419 [Rhizopus arrhizus]
MARRDDARPDAFPALRPVRLRRRARLQVRDRHCHLSPGRPHQPPVQFSAHLPDPHAVRSRHDQRSTADGRAREPAGIRLPAAAGVLRPGENGRIAQGRPRPRGDRRLAVGRVPG